MNRINTLTLMTCLVLTAGAVQAEQTVVYKQMSHVAVGSAKLSVSPDGRLLRARNLRPGGQDGFRTLLPPNATSWRGSFVARLDDGDTLRFNPISDGAAIAPLEVTATATGLNAMVEFTSSQDPVYTLHVREAGALVAVWNCVPGGDCTPPEDPEPPTGGPGGGVIIDFEPVPDPEIDDPTLFEDGFHQDNEGNCVHAMRMTGTTAIYVGGLHLGDGDELVVVEHARQAQPRYPYAGFEAMRVQTSAPQIVFVDESAH